MSNKFNINEVYDFAGKTAIVTGGSGILGGEIACALVESGANVAILDRNTTLNEEYEQRLKKGEADIRSFTEMCWTLVCWKRPTMPSCLSSALSISW